MSFNKHYYSLNEYLYKKFGKKIYKLCLNGGMTCPNRDGKIGYGGCIFCSNGGSGEFAQDSKLSISDQIELAKLKVKNKISDGKYIAYFQAFTNTYAPTNYLEKIFSEAIFHPDIVAISIATRPDCISEETLNLLAKLNKIKPVWIEIGLQTIHNQTANFIRRGYDLDCFENALKRIKLNGLEIIVHIILGLPGENKNDILETILYLNSLNINGIKLQLLHVLKNTKLAEIYNQIKFKIFTLDEYTDLIIECIEHISKEIVIHRLTGDGARNLLIEPKWSLNKKVVLNEINRKLNLKGVYQGSKLDSQNNKTRTYN